MLTLPSSSFSTSNVANKTPSTPMHNLYLGPKFDMQLLPMIVPSFWTNGSNISNRSSAFSYIMAQPTKTPSLSVLVKFIPNNPSPPPILPPVWTTFRMILLPTPMPPSATITVEWCSSSTVMPPTYRLPSLRVMPVVSTS